MPSLKSARVLVDQTRGRLKSAGRYLAVAALVHSSSVWAGLPTAPAGGGTAANDPMGALKYWLGIAAAVLLLALSLAAFYIVTSGLIHKFHEWRSGRGEGSEVLVHGAAGFALIVVVIMLVTEASKIFTSTSGYLN